MIKSVTVINHLGESLTLELGAPDLSGLLIQQIEGLGPAKATINTTELATYDGALYNSARLQMRNIVMTLVMMWAPTIEDARQKTYRFFPIKKQITLVFETDNRYCECTGYVESNTPDIFSKKETTVISILCPDPFFYSVNDGYYFKFGGYDAMFEFPFSNESPSIPLLIMSEKNSAHSGTLLYGGDSDSGLMITIHGLGTVTGTLVLACADTGESMEIDTSKITGGFANLDDIMISTHRGNKFIYLLRNGVYTNVINALGKNSDWLSVHQGLNTFSYQIRDGSGADNLEIKMDYRMTYEGV